MNTYIDWKHRTGNKDNGAPIFDAAKQIASRVEFKRRLIRNEKGEQVVSEATIFTAVRVDTGDTLTIDGRDWVVISSYPHSGLSGMLLYYEVAL